MPIGQYTDGPVQPRTPVKQLYHDLLSEGMDPKAAAKTAQERTGVSVVTGQPIVKKVEFSQKGKTSYGGQYAGSTVGTTKRWKPAAWPK